MQPLKTLCPLLCQHLYPATACSLQPTRCFASPSVAAVAAAAASPAATSSQQQSSRRTEVITAKRSLVLLVPVGGSRSCMAHTRRLDVLQKQMRGYATTTERVTEKAAEAVEDAAEGTVKQLHPAFTKFLNSGYMESQRQLRDELLTREWDGTVAPWAAVKGLAQFEQYVVEKGRDVDIHVSWEVMQRLYADPSDLSPLEGNERARLLAHAFITQAREAQRWEVYKQVSETSKQLADVIESGERTGASTLWSLIRRMLPLPPFLK